MRTVALLCSLSLLFSCNQKEHTIIASGQMPALTKDETGKIHMVYGVGDSLMYVMSANNGTSFEQGSLVGMLPALAAAHMRGPQIAASKSALIIAACTTDGNIYSFRKELNGNWSKPIRVNDVDTIAKENFLALGADDENVFAVWLDLRGNKQNKIVGARSTDGGKTWSPNQLIYASPDSSVCECCKPSVLVKGNRVYVMFRNWLGGSRDMYLAQSDDGGDHFNAPQKLGAATWKLNGCPMDGGGIAINDNGIVQTTWRREGTIYSAVPGSAEHIIGTGKGCTIATINNENVYGWTNDDNIIITTPQQEQKIIGKGNLPQLKAIDDKHVICVWQDEKDIHASVVSL